jgi:hypothetical protein
MPNTRKLVVAENMSANGERLSRLRRLSNGSEICGRLVSGLFDREPPISGSH